MLPVVQVLPSFSSGSQLLHVKQFSPCLPEHDKSDPEDSSGLNRLEVDSVFVWTKGLVIRAIVLPVPLIKKLWRSWMEGRDGDFPSVEEKNPAVDPLK